jgi:hypothetical protein
MRKRLLGRFDRGTAFTNCWARCVVGALAPLLILASPLEVRPVRTASVYEAQGGELSAREAARHIGELATVCGTVASARYAARSRGQPTFLNFDQPYPNQLFTVVIWGDARRAFPEPPERAYEGKRICVSGRIESYRGLPQIVVQSPSAIRIAGTTGR